MPSISEMSLPEGLIITDPDVILKSISSHRRSFHHLDHDYGSNLTVRSISLNGPMPLWVERDGRRHRRTVNFNLFELNETTKRDGSGETTTIAILADAKLPPAPEGVTKASHQHIIVKYDQDGTRSIDVLGSYTETADLTNVPSVNDFPKQIDFKETLRLFSRQVESKDFSNPVFVPKAV